MKISVHAGHGAKGSKSPGAVGLIEESVEDRKVKDELIKYLKQEGHTVLDATVDYPSSANDCLKKICALTNNFHPDLSVSIHFNSGANNMSGNGKITGVEVFSYNSSSRSVAYSKRIADKISSLGFRNRGVKYSTSLYVLNHIPAPSLLVECCFVDDKDDVNLYKKIGAKGIAKAIAEGILNKTINDSSDKEFLVKIKVDSLNVREKATINSKVVTTVKKGDVFTIVGVEGYWGKLKSGSGYISILDTYVTRL